LHPGSLRASIFALMACALGAGSLALPKALFRNCGFVNGFVLLIMTGLISLLCLNFLMKASIKANILNYSELVRHCFSQVLHKKMHNKITIIINNFKRKLPK